MAATLKPEGLLRPKGKSLSVLMGPGTGLMFLGISWPLFGSKQAMCLFMTRITFTLGLAGSKQAAATSSAEGGLWSTFSAAVRGRVWP